MVDLFEEPLLVMTAYKLEFIWSGSDPVRPEADICLLRHRYSVFSLISFEVDGGPMI